MVYATGYPVIMVVVIIVAPVPVKETVAAEIDMRCDDCIYNSEEIERESILQKNTTKNILISCRKRFLHPNRTLVRIKKI